MKRLTGKAFIVTAFMSLAIVFTANSQTVQHRYFEYFEGLPENYIETDWQGYNYHASIPLNDGTALDLYSYPKTIGGRQYTCVGWKDATGSITPQSGDINRVTFELRADSSITWIYKKAYEVTFKVSPMKQAAWSWGRNSTGQLGDGSQVDKAAAVDVGIAGASIPWASVTEGWGSTLAIKEDGTLWAWGYNYYGQLGLGDNTERTSPVQVGTDNRWTAVAAGYLHSLGIKEDGTLWAWGGNNYGQLGLGTSDSNAHPNPTQIGAATDWAAVAVAEDQSLAIKKDGTLWAWGRNAYGQLGLGTSDSNAHPDPTQVGADNDWTAVAAGGYHTLAIKSDGTLWAWGRNYSGQLGLGHTTQMNSPTQVVADLDNDGSADTDWAAVAAGEEHSLAMKEDGTLWAWGSNAYGQLGLASSDYSPHANPSQVGTETDWAAVVSGVIHSLGIKKDGTLWAWGYNYNGELGLGDTDNRSVPTQVGLNNDWVAVAGGAYDTLGVNKDGVLWGWGWNADAELGLRDYDNRYVPTQLWSNTNVISIAAGDSNTLALKSDGSLWKWGYEIVGVDQGKTTTIPTQVEPGTRWTAVAAGLYHTLAIKADGTLWAWGYGQEGQLGLGPGTTVMATPTQVGQDDKWVAVAAGTHSLALKSDGTLWAWGNNVWGQLGLGTIDRQWNPSPEHPTPTQVTADLNGDNQPDDDWVAIAAGDYHSVALKRDGSIFTWGSNLNGELGIGKIGFKLAPNWVNNVFYEAWGTPLRVTIGTPATWKSVAAGGSHTVAIRSDGTLWAWGKNDYGQLGISLPAAGWLWNPATRHEYALTPPLYWWEAEDWANANGAHLVTVSDAAESNWLVQNFIVPYDVFAWIGYVDYNSNNVWAWASGEPVQYTHWRSGEPNNISSEQYTVIQDINGGWNNVQWNNRPPGIMERTGRPTPMQVGSDSDWVSVAAGRYHTLGLREDGSLWAWGRNDYGELGDGTTTSSDSPIKIGSENDWNLIAAGENHSIALRGPKRLELEPHMGPKFVTEGTEVNASAKVIPTDGQGAPYNLTSFTSNPTTYGSSFTVESGVHFTWTFEEAREVEVNFAQGVPESVQNASNAFPAESQNSFVEGSTVTLQVDPVVTDQDTGTVYVCTGWTGTGQVPASGNDNSVIIPSLDQNSSITWNFAEARSLTTNFNGLPEHLQSNEGFDPRGTNQGWDPQGPVWLVKDSTQTLTPPTEIYDEGGRVRYVLDLGNSGGTGDLSSVQDLTDQFTLTQNSTVTWVYRKEMRLRINIGLDRSSVQNPDDSAVINATDPSVNYRNAVSTADMLPWDIYYKDDPNAAQPVSVTLSVNDHPDINGNTVVFQRLNVLSGDEPITAPQQAGDVMQATFQLTQPTELVWDYENAQRLFIGRAITPPTGADGTVEPQIAVDPPLTAADAFFWDVNNNQLYPVRPLASAAITWQNQNVTEDVIKQPVYAVWPSYETVWAWGGNDKGQLGDGTTTTSYSPLEIASDNDWKAVTIGEYHTLALKTDGTLWAWGLNDHGQLGFQTPDSDQDGAMDPALNPTQVGTDTNWTAVSAGGYHTLALKTDGTLWAWGLNDHGQLGLDDTNDRLVPTQVDGTDWISIAAGKSHSLALKANKTLYGWGRNDYGELGISPFIDKLIPTLSASGPWQTVTAGSHHTLALKEDGMLFAWGYDVGVGTSSGTTGWVSVAAGDAHSLGIKKDGTLWTWGLNNNGQLGLNTSDGNQHPDPTQVGTDTDWVAVAGGFRHSVAVRAGGTLWAWGGNANGQLGLGDTINRSVPTRVGTDIYWSSVAAGYSHTLALKSTIQKHIVQTPARLEPEGGQYSFEKLHYSEGYEDPDTGQFVDPNIPVENPEFNPPSPGRSLLRFSGGANDPPLFVVVNSVRWNEGTLDELSVNIGKDIKSPKDQSGQDIHQDPEGKNGYVFFEKGYYDGVGDDRAYDRSTREGQIIPVNETTASTAPDRQMVVVWYETGAAGVGWPVRPVRYLCQWPADPEKIIIASGNGSEPLAEQEYMGKIYYQPDPDQAGYNPNEEHALLLGNKVFALRNDLNTLNGVETSKPYVLLKYWVADTESWLMTVFKVEATGTDAQGDHQFDYPITAGSPILPLMPMDVLPKPEESSVASGEEWYYRDHKGGHWAKASGQNSTITMHWYYPLQSGFYYPLHKADGSPVGVGDPVPFLNGGNSHQDPPMDVTYQVTWPGDVKTLNIGETLTEAKYGLPDIVNWAAGQIIFDESVHNGGGSLAKLIDPYTERSVPLNTLPDSIRTENVEGKLRFPDLPYSLRSRLFYDPTNEKLIFKGISYDPGIGEPLLLPNIMTVREKDLLEDFEPYWRSAVEDLFWETRNTIAGSQKLLGVPMALTAGAAAGQGYVVLAENDDESLEAAPVALHVIRVADGPYRGEIKVIKPDNVFDEKLTLRHSGDFGGEPERFYFAWYYKPDNSGLPPPLPGGMTDTNGWVLFDEGPGMIDITIEGAGKLTLSDNWFMVHYYYGDHPEVETAPAGYPALATGADPNLTQYWSDWAGAPGGQTAQLAPGWIKRVVADLNPLDARVKDFRNYEVSTDVSVITQIGERYEGDIALNGAPDNLNNLGLIEAYETVLNRAKEFSIDASPPSDYGPVNNAILNAGTRIADFYTMLGNEAYRDALDPTIGFDTRSGALGTMASSIFAFQNQLSSLLEEELALLRGRDDTMSTTRAKPVYNRLVWNFTQGDGELAYVQTYNIRDMDESGVVDELDAKEMYPQGHGDAWGHYLTAMTVWYGLLRHEYFTWEPRIESVLVGGTPIPVDYLDERKFAQTAAAKAKVGAEIVNLTYRRSYVEEPTGQWQGYKDTDPVRAWGVDGWARRAGQGAYFDWVVANAMLPEKDPVSTHTGIQKIDRSTVPELASIASEFFNIQNEADRADRGLNPLGLAKGVVPFDIDPYLLTPTPAKPAMTHFEQVYDRALGALENARTVFDYATQYTLMLRQNEDSLVNFKREIEDQERNYTNRLIEIFGYPYDGDLGAGGTYKADYIGPDLFHFMVMDLPDLTGEPLMGQQVAYTYTFDFADTAFDEDGDPLVKGLNVTTKTDPATGQITPGAEITYLGDSEDPWLSRPSSWGKRRAPGEVQMALADLIKAHADYKRGLTELEGQLGEIQAAVDILEAKHGILAEQISVMDSANTQISKLEKDIMSDKKTQVSFSTIAHTIEDAADIARDGIPQILGLSNDVAAAARAMIKRALWASGGATGVAGIFNGIAVGYDVAQVQDELDIAEKGREMDRKLFIADARFEVQQMVKELETMESDVRAKLQELYGLREVILQSYGRYQAVLAEGERLLTEREVFRKRAAADVEDYRYQDIGFRTFRNDAVEKYRATFELAARYAYLAATAYDYETNLLGSETGSGRAFLTDIVKQRSPGVIMDGKPVVGKRGLADPLARLSQNFQVYKGQLGFNNPQIETNRFALRRELFRFKDDQASDVVWRAELENYVVNNLWNFPPFRRFCRPFADESIGTQPGLVIPFSTEVNFGYNFFGWPLGARDSAYDPSNFATKIRAVGVWFKGYENANLSSTPRVYLVPVGADVLRTPDGDDFTTREWYVMDQKLPVPFPVSDAELSEETWIPVHESLSDVLGEARRFSSFRAFPDLDDMSEADIIQTQSTTDTRLVGRSVWNSQWLLIIPGGTLLADPAAGLNAFVNNVEDIKLFFQTYAYSGN